MNYAIVFAGGMGTRMRSPDLPKQFIEVSGKPIVVHTILHFQRHPEINGVVVVCLESWIPYMIQLIAKFHLDKVIKVVKGGRTGQESIYNGLCAMIDFASPDDVVLIHDGVRPIIDADLISRNIKSVIEFGNAISVSSATETLCIINEEDNSISRILNRNQCYLGRAPQSFRFCEIFECHKKAIVNNFKSAIDSASLLLHYDYRLFYVQCSHFNIKITTPIDLYLFKCYISSQN